MEAIKDIKYYIKKLQDIADKHESLKKEAEALILEGDKIQDKFKDASRIFSLTESVNQIMNEIDDIEKENDAVLKEYQEQKNKK